MTSIDFLRRIRIRCGDFLSHDVPLYKHIPPSKDYGRVKVRFKHRLRSSPLNDVVGEQVADRCVLTTTYPTSSSTHFIFPVDGFKLIWAPDNKLPLDDAPQAPIRHGNLQIASLAQRDVAVYDIPDYYVVSVNLCPDYTTLVEAINASTFEPTQFRD